MQPFRKVKKTFLEGYRYGYQTAHIKSNQKRIDNNEELINRNERLIQSANLLLERTKQHSEKMEEEAREHNDPHERQVEWVFYRGSEARPVTVLMSEDFYTALQLNNAKAWQKVTDFVDAELKRREEEGEA